MGFLSTTEYFDAVGSLVAGAYRTTTRTLIANGSRDYG